jgi:hypothetical protein
MPRPKRYGDQSNQSQKPFRLVFKYAFAIEDEFELELPADAQILRVAVQNSQPCIWALVDDKAVKVKRRFRLAGTGHPIEDFDRLTHVATFFMASGRLVWHLFEDRPGTE